MVTEEQASIQTKESTRSWLAGSEPKTEKGYPKGCLNGCLKGCLKGCQCHFFSGPMIGG